MDVDQDDQPIAAAYNLPGYIFPEVTVLSSKRKGNSLKLTIDQYTELLKVLRGCFVYPSAGSYYYICSYDEPVVANVCKFLKENSLYEVGFQPYGIEVRTTEAVPMPPMRPHDTRPELVITGHEDVVSRTDEAFLEVIDMVDKAWRKHQLLLEKGDDTAKDELRKECCSFYSSRAQSIIQWRKEL